MPLSFYRLQELLNRHETALRHFELLYAAMDTAYNTAAEGYGFECRGCEDNCCLTRFHHHTLVELVGLFIGYRKLPESHQDWVDRQARDYCRHFDADRDHKNPFRRLCPLNLDTRCLLYRQRPMICRLHGIPHRLRHPVKGVITGPGCDAFDAACGESEGRPLDRTPLYAAMAELEKTLRQATGYREPIRLTVAEMIVCFRKENRP